MTTERLAWTDEATIGRQLVVLAINEQGQTLNPTLQTFGARTDECEILMTELSSYPGTHLVDVPLPDDVTDIMFRIEELDDPDHKPLGAPSRPSISGVVSNLADLLDVVVPHTAVDGGPDVTVGRLFLELLSVAKGMWRIDRVARTKTLHLLGTNEVLRTFQVVRNQTESARKPPDAV